MRRLPRLSRLPVALALGAAALAGCGQGSYSPADEMRSTVQAFLSTCSQQDPVRVIDELNPPAQRAFIEGGETLDGCARILQLPVPAHPTPDDYANAIGTLKVASWKGGSGPVRLHVDGFNRVLDLTYGVQERRIEGPH